MHSSNHTSPMNTLSPSERTTLLQLARTSIQHGLQHGSPMIVQPGDYNAALQQTRACFVTLNLQQELRGCIGTLDAYQALVCDVATNAYNAAFRDPRFAPLSAQELEEVEIHISVLSPPSPMNITSEEDLLAKLKPGIDGLIIKEGLRQATFLPSVWQSLPNPKDFVSHLKQKAGLAADYWSDHIEVFIYHSESFAE